jgi:hypothetical protein
MKKLLLLICFLFLHFTNAQNAAAKMYVNNFNKLVEETKVSQSKNMLFSVKSKIESMQKTIATINAKDASYNTSEMESKVEEFKIWLVESEQKKEQKINDQFNNQWADINVKRALDYLFKEANLNVGSFSADIAQKRLEEYIAKMNEVLKATKNVDEDYVRYISRFGLNVDSYLDKKKSLLAEVNNKDLFEPAFLELKLYQAYWDAAQKIYPNETEFAANYNKVTALRNSIGSLDDVDKIASKNLEAQIKDRKLPSPVAHDAALEKFFIDGFTAKYGKKYNGVAIKCVLTQDGWTTERHKISGVVTGRNRTAKMVYKSNDGKCYLVADQVFYYEEFIGGKFTNRQIIYSGLGGQEMLCENVK